MKVAIVGGGITGLSCAYYLGRADVEATVFDPAPGGSMGSETIQGCLLEAGPESWLAAKPWAEQLIRELGMGDDLVGSNDAARRTYVLRKGRFVTLPEGLQLVVPTKAWPIVETPLFSWATKIKMGLEIFRSPKAMPDRSVSDFVRDHFGQEAVEYLAEPLLAGVYGGSPDDLSAPSVLPKFVEYEQKYGSVVVGTIRQKFPTTPGQPKPSIFKGLKRGMGSLVAELSSRVNVVRSRVESIAKGEQGWGVRVDGEWLAFDQVVMACGANFAAPMIAPFEPRLGDLLASIPYSGSEIWTFGFNREDVPHPLDAFGFLVPRRERKKIMACTWLNTKWLNRVPEGKAVLRCFSTSAGITRQEILDELRDLMGIVKEPIFSTQHKWPDSMAQYTVGHMERVAEIDQRVDAIPGLYLAGNAFHGIGIPDCVKSAKQAAGAVVEYAASLSTSSL